MALLQKITILKTEINAEISAQKQRLNETVSELKALKQKEVIPQKSMFKQGIAAEKEINIKMLERFSKYLDQAIEEETENNKKNNFNKAAEEKNRSGSR